MLAYTPSNCSARASVVRAPAIVVATAITRVTPAARARSSASGASSPRCACVSITRRRLSGCGVGAHARELFVDHRVVELLEELPRRLQGLARRKVAGLPASDPR